MSGITLQVPPVGKLADSPDGESETGGLFHDVRLLEFLLAIVLFAQTAVPGLPVSFPATYLAMGVLLVVAAMRHPRWPLTPLNGYVWAFAVLLGYYALVSATGVQSSGAGDWVRRLIRMVILLFFVGALASGRLHFPSIIKGFAAGLVANVVLFYAGVAPHPYQDFLTGFAGDKNTAGLVYAMGGLLLLTTLKSRRERIVVFLVFASLVFLTGSRTTMAGMTAAALWIIFAARLPALFRLGIGGLLVWGLQFGESRFARIGIFADRSGTDWFREQIATAVTEKVAITPPQGLGLGEAYVNIPQGMFFFHNSYDTLFVEGGYVALILVVGITLLAALRPFRAPTVSWTELVVEGATITLLVCAWQLGEVFLTVSWALLVAAGLQAALMRRADASGGELGEETGIPLP
ncbi:hypothetical protein [Raineyella sp. LH-20]|uniref:hypothetical protein n=1 Tax=Raineyella sp. LH-20 TaxID=3081204 RepID=UPI00295409D8|nr:hypothetical protein [Raineyella sp. LH-20]WOP20105.1 hypothetical protein R0146_07465 [Raineyella sp. LH-20]